MRGRGSLVGLQVLDGDQHALLMQPRGRVLLGHLLALLGFGIARLLGQPEKTDLWLPGRPTRTRPGHPNGHLLALAGQVVHAGSDVLVVGVDLHVEELPLGVEGRVGLLEPHQLRFPPLAVAPLVPDVLEHT